MPLKSIEVFSQFVPAPAVSYCDKLYQKLGFELKIKKARKTKMGDYRFHFGRGKHTITINNDLNPYAFLVTYLHEVAHLVAFKKHGRAIKPHGAEWKVQFRQLMEPLLNAQVFDDRLLPVLIQYFRDPKASSCADPSLYAMLRQYDAAKEGTLLLKQVAVGAVFLFDQRKFEKVEVKRTRSICVETKTGKKYAISEMAEVIQTK